MHDFDLTTTLARTAHTLLSTYLHHTYALDVPAWDALTALEQEVARAHVRTYYQQMGEAGYEPDRYPLLMDATAPDDFLAFVRIMLGLTLLETIELIVLPHSNEVTVAQVAHEVNRWYCQTLQDLTQVPWHEAPNWIRQSAINGVECVRQEPVMHAGMLHDSWLRFKEADGWQYGPVKDAEKKEHPCMVPFHALPKDQQVKDHLFMAVVKLFS